MTSNRTPTPDIVTPEMVTDVPRIILKLLDIGRTGLLFVVTTEFIELLIMFISGTILLLLHFWFTLAVLFFFSGAYIVGYISKWIYLRKEKK